MASRTECEFVVMRLWPYLDSALSDDERERIVHHLEVCGDCHSHFDFADAFLDAVAAARPHLRISNDLRSRVMGALTAEGFRAAN
jgi:anti-sigma factor (TIGR02949 family)